VAGNHAYYFNGLDPQDLATAIRDWLSLLHAGLNPRSNAIPWRTWEESAHNLLDVILQGRWQIMWPQSSQVVDISGPAGHAASSERSNGPSFS
jgi:hypothetical protein